MNDYCMIDDCNKPAARVQLPGLTARQTFYAIAAAYASWEEESEEEETGNEFWSKSIYRKGDQMVMLTLHEEL